MKKIILILLMSGFIQLTNAQVSFRAGLEGGVNNNLFLQNQFQLTHGPFTGIQMGIGGLIKVNRIIGFSIAISKNTIHQDEISSISFPATKVSYLEIPCLLRITTRGKKVAFYFETGPEYASLSNGNDKVRTSYDPNKNSYYYTTNTFAFLTGFGLDINAGDRYVIIAGFRAGIELTNATKEYPFQNDLGSSDDYTGMSKAFYGLHLGVAYNFKPVEKKADNKTFY